MDLDNPINCLTNNAQKIARSFMRDMEGALRVVGLTSQQFTTLTILKKTGTVTMGDLASIINVERTTMTRNINHMCQKEWVEYVSMDDKRIKALTLTKLGKELQSKAYPLWQEEQHKIAAKIGNNLSEDILNLGKKI